MPLAVDFLFDISYVDYSDRIHNLLLDKVNAGMGSAAKVLTDTYRTELTAEQAPPHSAIGEVPHAYHGHKPGGFGPLLGFNETQNVTFFGFSRDQSDNLATYIRGARSVDGDKSTEVIGFEDSHVTERRQNYLIQWDQGTVPQFSGIRRPWIIPLYRKVKSAMISAFKSSFTDRT